MRRSIIRRGADTSEPETKSKLKSKTMAEPAPSGGAAGAAAAAVARLTYFQGRGRAETTRWMLAAAEIPFECVALQNGDELQALRSTGKLLFNQLPLLEIGGASLTQSIALVQHVARVGGLYGDTPADAAMCDMVHGVSKDLAGPPMGRCFQEDQAAALEKMASTLNKFAPFLERIVDGQSGFIVGTKLSMADVLVAEALTSYVECLGGCLDPFPKLKALRERVVALPQMQKYLESSDRYGKPDNAYVIAVAAVLERALPPHFPDPTRFVKTEAAEGKQ